MYRKLASIAAELDARGLYGEADVVTSVLQKVSERVDQRCDCGGMVTRRVRGGDPICNKCGRNPLKGDENFEGIQTQRHRPETWDKSTRGKRPKHQSRDLQRKQKMEEHRSPEYASRKAGMEDPMIDR